MGRSMKSINDPRGNRPKENLGKFLDSKRGARGRLCGILGVDRRTLSRWITGESFMPNDKLIEASCALKVGVPFLLDWTDDEAPHGAPVQHKKDVRQATSAVSRRKGFIRALGELDNPENIVFYVHPNVIVNMVNITMDRIAYTFHETYPLDRLDEAMSSDEGIGDTGWFTGNEEQRLDLSKTSDEFNRYVREIAEGSLSALMSDRSDLRAIPPIMEAAVQYIIEHGSATTLEASIETMTSDLLRLTGL